MCKHCFTTLANQGMGMFSYKSSSCLLSKTLPGKSEQQNVAT